VKYRPDKHATRFRHPARERLNRRQSRFPEQENSWGVFYLREAKPAAQPSEKPAETLQAGNPQMHPDARRS
jgi:hypothetical protein